MKSFNDSVVYVLNGKPIPGTVLKSIPSEGGELLTLLYADPEGEKQIAAGSTRYVGQIASMVKPLSEGSQFGWKDSDADAEIAGLKKDSADLSEQFLEAQKQISEAIAQRDEARALVVKLTPPPVVFDAPTDKSSGDDQDAGDWTKHGDGTDYPDEKPIEVVQPLPVANEPVAGQVEEKPVVESEVVHE